MQWDKSIRQVQYVTDSVHQKHKPNTANKNGEKPESDTIQQKYESDT